MTTDQRFMQDELSNHEVALRSRQVLDLGPRQARLIFLAGMAGVVLLVVASLVGNRKKGVVSLFRKNGKGDVRIARATAGEMFGLPEEILHEPVMATVVAETPVELYQTDYDRLIADVGGRDQPLGVVLADLAVDLQDAWAKIAALEETEESERRPLVKREWLRSKYVQERERHDE